MSSPPSPMMRGRTNAPESPEPPFSPGLVEELLRLIVKAARAQQLYLPNNPIYHGVIDALQAAFVPVWEKTDELCLTIVEGQILWYDRHVLGESGGVRSPDNLAWLFHKDGVCELTLAKGIEEGEFLKLLQIIQRARKASPEEDDLVTMLWEADLAFVNYKYVDVLEDGSGGELADGSEARPQPPPSPSEIERATKAAVAEFRAAGVVSLADFNATLYFLDDSEIEYLHGEIRREYEQDLRANIVSVLLDVFESQPDPDIRTEVLDDLETVMVYLLTAGHFRGVANLLREAQATVARAEDVTPAHTDRLAQLSERLSAPDALSQLLQALQDAPILPPQAELSELFDQLRPAALATLFAWISKSQGDKVRKLLDSAADRLTAANTTELIRLIQVPEHDVSSEAIRRAGVLKAQAAVLALATILGDPAVQRRQLAVQALTEIGSPGALQALERMIADSDRDVRIAAVRAFTLRNYRPVLARLEVAVKSKALRDADLTEKMAFFEAYGALCGDSGVAELDTILNGKGFFGRREGPEIRACAAIALGRVGSPKSAEALRKAASEKDIVVRNAVTRALRTSETPS